MATQLSLEVRFHLWRLVLCEGCEAATDSRKSQPANNSFEAGPLGEFNGERWDLISR